MSDQFISGINFGCVNYINAFPFSLYLQKQSQIRLTLSSPDCLLRMLLNKEIDIALTSAAAALHYPLTYHSSFGISANQQVLSVNLYAQPSFFTKPSRVAVPRESTSSLALLQTLSHHVWNQKHQFVSFPMQTIPKLSHTQYDALLLIGDTALRHLDIPYFTRYDLAYEWYTWTKLPFVFATLLTVHSNQKSYEKLFSALEEAIKNADRSVILEAARQQTNLPISLLKDYYSLLHYRLTAEDHESLHLFKHYYSHVQKA